MTLGEFRALTAHLPDEIEIITVDGEHGEQDVRGPEVLRKLVVSPRPNRYNQQYWLKPEEWNRKKTGYGPKTHDIVVPEQDFLHIY